MSWREAVRAYITDPLERAAFTALQSFIAIVFAGQAVSFADVPWLGALAAAGIAAASSVILSAATFKVPHWPLSLDLAMRVLRTFAASLAGYLAVGQGIGLFSLPVGQVVLTALGAAGAALVKGLIAAGLPGTADGASMLGHLSAATEQGKAAEAVQESEGDEVDDSGWDDPTRAVTDDGLLPEDQPDEAIEGALIGPDDEGAPPLVSGSFDPDHPALAQRAGEHRGEP